MVILPVLFVGAFYLLLVRPQQRRIASVRRLQSEIREGDDILTTSGIYGRITRLGDSDADLEIAPGTVIHVARGAIGQRMGEDPTRDLDAGPHPHEGDTEAG